MTIMNLLAFTNASAGFSDDVVDVPAFGNPRIL